MIKPLEIRYIKKNNILSLAFEDGLKENLTIEYLRCFSPYAVKLVFDDGHNTGLYTWEYLHELCVNYKSNWHNYLEKLTEAGYVRKKP